MDKLRLTLEVQYIGGYAIECSLKVHILEKTPRGARGTRMTRTRAGTGELLTDPQTEQEMLRHAERLAQRPPLPAGG
jgi:hypothetical protein